MTYNQLSEKEFKNTQLRTIIREVVKAYDNTLVPKDEDITLIMDVDTWMITCNGDKNNVSIVTGLRKQPDGFNTKFSYYVGTGDLVIDLFYQAKLHIETTI